MDKINTFFLAKYLQLKNKADRFMEEEDGMEVLQAVILVAIALVVAAALMAIIGGKDYKTNEESLLGKIYKQITKAFNDIFPESSKSN